MKRKIHRVSNPHKLYVNILTWPMNHDQWKWIFIKKRKSNESRTLTICVSKHWHVYWTMTNEKWIFIKKRKSTESRTLVVLCVKTLTCLLNYDQWKWIFIKKRKIHRVSNNHLDLINLNVNDMTYDMSHFDRWIVDRFCLLRI